MMERWWICTDALARGGNKVLGPFDTQQLALDVRTHMEANPENRRVQRTFWVDSETVDPADTVQLLIEAGVLELFADCGHCAGRPECKFISGDIPDCEPVYRVSLPTEPEDT